MSATETTSAALLEQRRVFWTLQAAVWVLFGVVYYLAMLPQVSFSPLFLLGGKIIWAVTGFAITSLLAVLYAHILLRTARLAPLVGVAFFASIIVGPLWIFGLGTLLTITMGTNVLYDAVSFPFVAVNHFFVFLAWSGGYLVLALWDRARLRERDLVEASRLAQEAQLEVLRYQLNPHFLFNTMTSVRALIDVNPERARVMITRLSEFLRYSLDRRGQMLTTVDQEIEAMRHYLWIEMARFEDKLSVDVQLDQSAARQRVPSFILHPLVENAVRYGEPDESGCLKIKIGACSENGRLRLTVSNTGTLSIARSDDGSDRQSLGLRNVRERLTTLFPEEHAFRITQDGPWVRAAIELPTVKQ